jgi:hypothetical protein
MCGEAFDDTAHGNTLPLDLSCCTNIDIDGLFGLGGAHQNVSQRDASLQLISAPALVNRLRRFRAV